MPLRIVEFQKPAININYLEDTFFAEFHPDMEQSTAPHPAPPQQPAVSIELHRPIVTIPSSATPIVRQAAGGFTLFEVLISVLLLAVGLMAAAIMQLNAARSTQQSNFQSIALGLATQVAEEIRQNSTEANKPAPNAFLPMIYAATSAPSSISGNCYAVQCTSADLARMNRHEWQATLGDRLGKGARLEVCRDASVAGANGNYQWCNAATPADAFAPIAVKVGWMDKTTDADSVSVAPPKVVVLVSPTTQ